MGQHRVTEFYLRGFSQRRGSRVLFEYDKTSGFVREIKPKFASAASGIFAVEGPDENAVENFLGVIETRAKPVFVKLRNRLALEPDDCVALSKFISVAYVRSARVSEHFEKIRSLFTEEAIDRHLRSPAMRIAWMLKYPTKHWNDYDFDVADFIQSVQDGNSPPPSKPPVNGQFSLLKYQQGHVAMLLDMSWRVELACDGSVFLVGDEPLCARRPGQLFDSRYVPIASTDGEVSFPINRNMCLTARWSSPKEQMVYIPVDQARVHDINMRTVICAHRLFWSSERSVFCDEHIKRVAGHSIVITAPKTLEEFFKNPRGI